ncbi:DUF4389 domain-containing protein [Rhodoferax lacus]|uniref:DUF4389 domain-containing protein n=1 Tax=Rhodoferax lacus TaxID=2184758 RepID=A0A3E1R932_9BURK|nr:DUF4389 domain-containing protein [Rhodoferax lacus]RFO95879.1 DUF4389 domain-containing protein [Rhodoferax lacus]
MSDTPAPLPGTESAERSIWLRALLMLVLALCFQLASSLLVVLALAQWVLVLVSKDPNERLSSFARSLGHYLRQIAEFEGFASQALPFPFSDWPDV